MLLLGISSNRNDFKNSFWKSYLLKFSIVINLHKYSFIWLQLAPAYCTLKLCFFVSHIFAVFKPHLVCSDCSLRLFWFISLYIWTNKILTTFLQKLAKPAKLEWKLKATKTKIMGSSRACVDSYHVVLGRACSHAPNWGSPDSSALTLL